MQLRPYQEAAIEGAREQFRRGAKRCLIICPTGGGKTVIASSIISAAEARGSRALFLAHRRELITQTADKLMRCGVKPGLIIAGQPRALQRAVQVASVQTLARHPDLLRSVDLIFIDEAHHFVEDSQYGEVLKFHAGARVVGLTATPWRLDGKGLADVFDSHVIASTPAKLRDEGYLTNVVGWTFVAVSTSSAKVKGGDFTGQSMEAAALAPKLVGNVVQEWKARAGGVRSVLFACTIAHSQAMALAFRDAGVAAEHLDGSTPAGERAAILARIRSGATRVLCNVNVATEGWDEPSLECVMLCRPTLSTSLALQMIGRGLRPFEGKTVARIHDHAGIFGAHGHPYAERSWSPELTAEVERGAMRDGDGAARVTSCPACRNVIDQWPCASCGFREPPKELPEAAEGIAVQVSESAAWQAAMAKEEERKGRAERFKRLDVLSKQQSFFRFVERCHGNVKQAAGRYRWFSGETEWPPRQWSDDALAQLAAQRAGQ